MTAAKDGGLCEFLEKTGGRSPSCAGPTEIGTLRECAGISGAGKDPHVTIKAEGFQPGLHLLRD